MRKFILALTVVLALFTVASAQIAVPNVFSAGTTIRSADVNTNFSTIANHALDRISGGNLTGNVTADPGITFDGVDVGTQACTTCAPLFNSITIPSQPTGNILHAGDLQTAIGFAANGQIAMYLTNVQKFLLNASGLAVDGQLVVDPSGNVPTARLTGLIATANLGSGTPSATTVLRGDQTYALVVEPFVKKTTNYTIVATTDRFLEVTGTTTISLPACPGNTGYWAVVKNADASGNTVTVQRSGSDVIDAGAVGVTSFSLTPNQSSRIFCGGADGWYTF